MIKRPPLPLKQLELPSMRTEHTRTYHDGNGGFILEVCLKPLHYQDNYHNEVDNWKTIYPLWEGNKITRMPYALTHEGNKVTLLDKKSLKQLAIELLEVGNRPVRNLIWRKIPGAAIANNIAKDTDLEVRVNGDGARFTRILRSDKAPINAKFLSPGLVSCYAHDVMGQLPVEVTYKNGVLSEELKPNRPVIYPVRVDPSLNFQVGASADDCLAAWDGSSWLFSATSIELRVGYYSSTRYKLGGGMRFTGVNIPQGTTISSAWLKLVCYDSASATVVKSRIQGEDVDNASSFSDYANYSGRTRTTAVVDWDNISAWTLNNWYESPEIKSIVEEIVGRVGWSSGNALVIFWDDHDDRSDHDSFHYRTAYTYDQSWNDAPKLYIQYGWPHKISGVSYPSKIMGVSATSISKVKGVA